MNTPQFNENGHSVKGCSIIYSPNGQAGEYSKLASNPYKGCGHKCSYCYVPKVLQISREQFDSTATPRENFIALLIKDAKKYQSLGIKEQVMLSFTTDPYHPFDNSLTRQVLIELQKHGLGICTLTKGGKRAYRDLDLFRPNRDSFASTLTTLDDDYSQKWERGAALPMDRINTLKTFHNKGIFTWVSLEPTLSTESSISIVEHTHEFVDLFKIGRANYLPMTNTTDWKTYTERMLELVNKLGVKHYFKQDLQGYLPKGYHNPRYIDQFHKSSVPEQPVSHNVGTMDLFSFV